MLLLPSLSLELVTHISRTRTRGGPADGYGASPLLLEIVGVPPSNWLRPLTPQPPRQAHARALAARSILNDDRGVAFSASFPTRHTDVFASTGFVHAGVLLALTELAYAQFERHCAVTKPEHIVAVQRATHAVYSMPLRWQEGVTIEVSTTEADDRGFTQEFIVLSKATGSLVARFVHTWVWLDVNTGRRVDLPAEVQRRLLAG